MIVKKFRIDCDCGHSFFIPYVKKSRWQLFKDFLMGSEKCVKCKKRTTDVSVVKKHKQDTIHD